jgi:hypothetical protein
MPVSNISPAKSRLLAAWSLGPFQNIYARNLLASKNALTTRPSQTSISASAFSASPTVILAVRLAPSHTVGAARLQIMVPWKYTWGMGAT